MLRKPILALCNNRDIRPKVNLDCGEPEEWFDYAYLESKGITMFGFDFFVNWKDLNIPNEIWIKRIIDDSVKDLSEKDFSELFDCISKVDGISFINKLKSFCNDHEISCHYFLFKDSVSWKGDTKAIYDICITKPSITVLNPNEVQDRICELRKVAVSIGKGGLIYGTSSLECYLSTTQYFWPGDVDALLVDKYNNVQAIIEYKKHNLNSPIKEQTLLKYRAKDSQKYQSLGLLRDRFKNNRDSLPIIIIYYPTNSEIKHIKVEKVSGEYDNLQVDYSEIWDLPIRKNKDSLKTFTEMLWYAVSNW